jgi:hypothetical protein
MESLLSEGLVIQDHLTFNEQRHGGRLLEVHIEGRIDCDCGLCISVDKRLEADVIGRNVRSYSYSYHAWITATGQAVIRYDNAHGLNDLHCHIFDLNTGEGSLHTVPIDKLPTLDSFIRIAVKMVQDAQKASE